MFYKGGVRLKYMKAKRKQNKRLPEIVKGGIMGKV